MTAGRPRKPTALRMLHGSRKDRTNENEPKPGPAKVDPPKWLDREGKRVWREYAPKLSKLGLLTELDVEFFAHACSLAAVARKLLPGSADHLKVTRATYRILARYGFSPSDRGGLSVSPLTGDDGFDRFLKGKS